MLVIHLSPHTTPIVLIVINFLLVEASIVEKLKLGMHISVSCVFYTHHGIYVGDGMVVHYSGFAEFGKKGYIEQTSLKEFLGDKNDFKIIQYSSNLSIYTPEQIVERALSRVGENSYNLIFNNCEHFACWCVTGKERSDQVDYVMKQTSEAAVSYALIRSGLVALPTKSTEQALVKTLSAAAVPNLVSAGSSVVQRTLVSGALGAGGGAVAASVAGTTAAVGLGFVAAPVAIAAAPVILAGAAIGALFSLFS